MISQRREREKDRGIKAHLSNAHSTSKGKNAATIYNISRYPALRCAGKGSRGEEKRKKKKEKLD